MLKQVDGFRAGRCYDCQSDSAQPGGSTRVFPCTHEWYQFVSFGDGRLAPQGSLYSTIPSHIVKQINNLGHDYSAHMCLGVYGRGDRDETDWEDEEYQQQIRDGTLPKLQPVDPNKTWDPLADWEGAEIITTLCSNLGAVIEWAFVPFIVEAEDNKADDEAKKREL